MKRIELPCFAILYAANPNKAIKYPKASLYVITLIRVYVHTCVYVLYMSDKIKVKVCIHICIYI